MNKMPTRSERLAPFHLPKPGSSPQQLQRSLSDSDSISLLEKPCHLITDSDPSTGRSSSGSEKPQDHQGVTDATDHDSASAMQVHFSCDFSNSNTDDPKKMKRMLANRESARRSRLRKLEYIEKLRKEIVSEEAKVSLMSPQVTFYEIQREMLERENNVLKHKIEVLEEVKTYKEAEFRALIEERDAINMMNNMLVQQRGN